MNNGIKTREEIFKFIENNMGYLIDNFHISKIGLFGSFSRGEANDDSDIDLVIEFDDGIADLYELKENLREYFRKAFGREVDVVREKYLKPRAKKNILKEVIYVA